MSIRVVCMKCMTARSPDSAHSDEDCQTIQHLSAAIPRAVRDERRAIQEWLAKRGAGHLLNLFDRERKEKDRPDG